MRLNLHRNILFKRHALKYRSFSFETDFENETKIFVSFCSKVIRGLMNKGIYFLLPLRKFKAQNIKISAGINLKDNNSYRFVTLNSSLYPEKKKYMLPSCRTKR